jgi:hypothetical protein
MSNIITAIGLIAAIHSQTNRITVAQIAQYCSLVFAQADSCREREAITSSQGGQKFSSACLIEYFCGQSLQFAPKIPLLELRATRRWLGW